MSYVLKYAAVVAVAAVSAALSAGAVVGLSSATAPHALRAANAETRAGAAVASAHSAPEPAASATSITKSPDGHFWAQGTVNGAQVRFLVDTGATAVALTPTDAQRLGFTPADLNYTSRVVTAGGQARAASVKLTSITVAGARLNDVDALVIEKGLDTSLLGMAYLGRLSRFEGTRHTLVLTP